MSSQSEAAKKLSAMESKQSPTDPMEEE